MVVVGYREVIKEMAKAPYIIAYTLIVRNAQDEHIDGTCSRGGLDYAKKLAQNYLRIDITGRAASVEIYAYDPSVSWRDLQPLATVTLDDELEVSHAGRKQGLNRMTTFTGANSKLNTELGETQYSLRFGSGEHDCASCSHTEMISSLIAQYVGVQTFDIIITQDGEELGRGVYECLNANSHYLRVVREDGMAVGLIEKIAVPAGNSIWVLKAKRIDPGQPSLAIHYYEWLVFFAVSETDAEREAIQLEIQEMDEQAKLLGLRFHLGNQEVSLGEIEEIDELINQ